MCRGQVRRLLRLGLVPVLLGAVVPRVAAGGSLSGGLELGTHGELGSVRAIEPTSVKELAARGPTDRPTAQGSGRRLPTPASKIVSSKAASSNTAFASASISTQAPRLAGATAPRLASANRILVSTDGFAGMADTVNFSFGCSGRPCIEPPDPWIAAGPEHLVQSVNSYVRITSRAGAPVLTVDVDGFFGVQPAQRAASDPRIVYDPAHQRWVGTLVSYDCSNGYLYLAASQTPDPTGTWWRWFVTYPGRFPDYPGLGSSTDKVVLSSNEFGIDPSDPECIDKEAFFGSSLRVFDWSDIVAGTVNLNRYLPADDTLAVWRPAAGLSADTAVHAVVERGDGTIGYSKITGTNAAGNVLFGPVISVPITLTLPPAPAQPGSPSTIVDGGDERPTDAIWRSGSLWFVATGSCILDVVRACIYVREIATTSTPSVRQTIRIGETTFDSFMGGIGLAQDGTLFVAFTRSSTTSPASSYATFRLATDALNTVRAPVLITAGTGSYPGTRWGDYVGVATDPVEPGSVWQANQYTDAGAGWATWVSRLSVEGPPATALSFASEPYGGIAQSPFSAQPVVRLLDGFGAPVTSGSTSSPMVSLSLDPNASGGTLSCNGGLSKKAVGGVATFDGCAVTSEGSGYTISASASGLISATSAPFMMVAPGTAQPTVALAASPSAITYGGSVNLVASLTGPAPEINTSGRTIDLQSSPDGAAWATIGTVMTDATGTATLATRPNARAFYRAVFPGSPDLAPAASETPAVTVRQTATLRPTSSGAVRTVSRGTKVTFSTTVRPVQADVPGTVTLAIYRRVGSAWILFASRTLRADASGRATYTWSFSTIGSWYVRSMARATLLNAASAWTRIERYDVR